MTDVLLPEVGRIYKLRNLNQWVKVIMVETQTEYSVWYAMVWAQSHAGWWSDQRWLPVEEIMLGRVRDR